MRVGMTKMGWQMDEEVNRDKTGKADEINLEVDSKDQTMHDERSVIFKETVGGRERMTADQQRKLSGVEER